jgi:hypothetical protein
MLPTRKAVWEGVLVAVNCQCSFLTEEICDIITAKTQKQMSESLFLAVCADSWSSAGRHLTAVTGGNPGLNIYLDSYENLGSEDAQGAADAIQQCVMTSLGVKVDMDPHDATSLLQKWL